MKKPILLIFCALCGITAAMAQKPFYGEWRIKSSDKLEYKIWDNGKVIRMEVPDKEGKMFVNLVFGSDSLCVLMPENKTYALFTGEAMRGKTRKLLGVELEEVSLSIEKKFIKQETISGILCNHYEITQKDLSRDVNAGTMHKGSQFDKTWEAEGFRHYIQHEGADITMRILTNIVVGPQPAHLFVIPKGYTRGVSMDAMMDGMHNMMKEKIDKAQQGAKDLQNLQEGKKSSNKEANEMMESFKALEDLLKKKK